MNARIYAPPLVFVAVIAVLLSGCSREESEWQRLVEEPSISGFQEFVQAFPDGTHLSEAHERLEALRWQEVAQERDAEKCAAFLADYPAGAHADDAHALEDQLAWERALDLKGVEAFESYVARFPQGAHRADASQALDRMREDRQWENAKSLNTIDAYDAFLAKCPGGRHAAEAELARQTLAEERAWAVVSESATMQNVMAFLAKYPKRSHVQEANVLLGGLQWQIAKRDDSVESWEELLQLDLSPGRKQLALAYLKAAKEFQSQSLTNRRAHKGTLTGLSDTEIAVSYGDLVPTPGMRVQSMSLGMSKGGILENYCFFPEPLKVGDRVEVVGGDSNNQFGRGFTPVYVRALDRPAAD